MYGGNGNTRALLSNSDRRLVNTKLLPKSASQAALLRPGHLQMAMHQVQSMISLSLAIPLNCQRRLPVKRLTINVASTRVHLPVDPLSAMKCQLVTIPTANLVPLHSSSSLVPPRGRKRNSALTTIRIALYCVCICHLHTFCMDENFPFICQVNICKSSTHTKEIIIRITNIFFPCFIA